MSLLEAKFSIPVDETSVFELAPVSLWLEDASGVKSLFEKWKSDGMTSLRDWLMHPRYMAACLAELRIIKINQRTVDLFEADSAEQLLENIWRIITINSMDCIIEQWSQLWDGSGRFFGKTVNTTIKGRHLDVQIRGNILPGHEHTWDRVLVTIEDVTDLEDARRAATASEKYVRELFENSPVALWVKDFSEVKNLLDREPDVQKADLAGYFVSHPVFTRECCDAVRVIDFNTEAIRLFGARDKEGLTRSFSKRGNNAYLHNLTAEITGLWEGKLNQQCDVVDYTTDGREVHVERHLCVLSGRENCWSRVQIARIDISERKRAEFQLKYAGSHDPLTGLFNRAHVADALAHSESMKIHPMSFLMIDLNGLKYVNDTVGHSAGDEILCRASKILLDVCKNPVFAARVGGDEFLVVMPGFDEEASELMLREIERHVESDNLSSTKFALRFAVGAATGRPGESLDATIGRADAAMYERKALFYSSESVKTPKRA